ncbi:hypothetical protein N7495_000639 [Penicillium taxi]|uniref:uncharacterized protein n=1 Tax=Penicillium taxi TaxID=168475 RepID=UPI00254593A0|nr:uncharacterized protein N7495_000639 [Penicillium taxi]KAJ5907957.1 hypothetical protein N7495_000639 [Penicillium taxi]
MSGSAAAAKAATSAAAAADAVTTSAAAAATTTTAAATTPTTSTTSSSTSTSATTVYVTSTESNGLVTSVPSTITSSSATTTGALSTSTAAASHGLSASGTIAVAVVVPVVSVALIALAAIFLWRKRKAKKAAEEERRKEVEEYGFNPNNDPSGMGGVSLKDDHSSGYRGWGTTSAGRKASTNLSNGMGIAMSEGSGAGGYHHGATPSEGTVQYSDGVRPDSGEMEPIEPIGVLGAVPVSANRNGDIHRGPSNASSAYSNANRSEASEESHLSTHQAPGPYYGENPYYGEATGHGAWGTPEDYQPVIRDVTARRNTRIENPGVYPRQGNAGIAQNF